MTPINKCTKTGTLNSLENTHALPNSHLHRKQSPQRHLRLGHILFSRKGCGKREDTWAPGSCGAQHCPERTAHPALSTPTGACRTRRPVHLWLCQVKEERDFFLGFLLFSNLWGICSVDHLCLRTSFPHKENSKAQMVSMMNDCYETFKGKILTQTLSENRKEGNASKLILWGQQNPDAQTRQITTGKEN